MQAPVWVPHSIRSAWDNARIRWALRSLLATPPLDAASAQDADVEVHMLVCRRDFHLAILALKSLLRFEGSKIAVALTDDGSLTEGMRCQIAEHVRGCRWLPRRVTDDARIDDALRARPHLAALYDGPFPFARKLLHPILLAQAGRVIQLDSDAAFLRRPNRLLSWASGDNQHSLYLHDLQDEACKVPKVVREQFAAITTLAAGMDAQWRLQYYFFNAGLLAFRPEQCNLELAEAYLRWRVAAPRELQGGRPGIWFGDWTLEQTSYMVLFNFMEPPAEPLGDDYHLGFDPDSAFCHFMRHYLVQGPTLRLLTSLVGELA